MGHKSYGFERVKHCMVFDRAKNQMGLNWLKIVWCIDGLKISWFWTVNNKCMVFNGPQIVWFLNRPKTVLFGCLEKATNRQAFQCPPSYGFERAKHRMVCQRVTQVMIFERINHRMVLTGHEFVWCLNGPKNVLFSMVHKSNVFVEQAQNRVAFERVNQHPILKGRKLGWLCNGPNILWFWKGQESCGFRGLKKHMFFRRAKRSYGFEMVKNRVVVQRARSRLVLNGSHGFPTGQIS